MSTAVTPFKIHDENNASAISTSKKHTKRVEFRNDQTALKERMLGAHPTKDGQQHQLVKSQRKALSSLSTSQVNSRINTPSGKLNMGSTAGLGHKSNGNSFGKRTTFKISIDENQSELSSTKISKAKVNSSKSIEHRAAAQDTVHVSKSTEPNPQTQLPPIEDMMCSHVFEREDPHDIVLKYANDYGRNSISMNETELGYNFAALPNSAIVDVDISFEPFTDNELFEYNGLDATDTASIDASWDYIIAGSTSESDIGHQKAKCGLSGCTATATALAEATESCDLGDHENTSSFNFKALGEEQVGVQKEQQLMDL